MSNARCYLNSEVLAAMESLCSDCFDLDNLIPSAKMIEACLKSSDLEYSPKQLHATLRDLEQVGAIIPCGYERYALARYAVLARKYNGGYEATKSRPARLALLREARMWEADPPRKRLH